MLRLVAERTSPVMFISTRKLDGVISIPDGASPRQVVGDAHRPQALLVCAYFLSSTLPRLPHGIVLWSVVQRRRRARQKSG